MSVKNKVTARYTYDAWNRRVSKTAGGRTVHYHYDQDSRLIGESLANGTVLREYVYLRGEPVALLEYETQPGWYFYVIDHLGTPQQLVDAQGTVVWQAAYLPYGSSGSGWTRPSSRRQRRPSRHGGSCRCTAPWGPECR